VLNVSQAKIGNSPDQFSATRHQPEDHRQVEGAHLDRRSADRSKIAKSTVLSIEEEAVIASTPSMPASRA